MWSGSVSAAEFSAGGGVGNFQRPAFAFVEFAAVAQAEVDGSAAGDGVDPAGKFCAVAEQPQPPISADECLLRGFLRKRGIAKPAPRDGINAAFVALDEFAVALGIAAAHGGHGGLVKLAAVGHFILHDLTARQRRREIVTRRNFSAPKPPRAVGAPVPCGHRSCGGIFRTAASPGRIFCQAS